MAYYETYMIAWLVYLLAAIGVYFVAVKLSKYWVKTETKNYFRLFAAVVLFTPATHVVEGYKSIAPAFIVMFGELLTYGVKASLKGLVPLLFAMFLGAVILAADAYIKTLKAKKESDA